MGMEARELDVVGVGAGPANLALVTAMLDAREQRRPTPSAVFLEQSPAFAWHPGMLLPGSRLQVPFLKDLATQRNPRSRYTFLNYLFEVGRLEAFINLRELFPEREEFSAYLAWVAAHAKAILRYDAEVVELRPVARRDGRMARIEVEAVSASGLRQTISARAVVLAPGRSPALPPGVNAAPGGRLVHSAWLRSMRPALLAKDVPHRFLVVGGGQSAVETACWLLRELPLAQVALCHRPFALAALDDNPFVNERYFGAGVDAFYGLESDFRRRALDDLSSSNLGVAERSLLDELYRHRYAGLRSQRPRLDLLAGHELVGAEEAAAGVWCHLRDAFTGRTTDRAVDGLVLATGYEDAVPSCLQGLDPWLSRDAAGAYAVGRDYRLETDPRLEAAVFLHGVRQDRHGPAELNLSILALRVGVLLEALERLLLAPDQAATGLRA